MKSTLTIMRGLPGSGKSTLATKLLAKDSNAIRVNKDCLRKMLWAGLPWSGKREMVTDAVQMAIVKQAIADGKNVIVDNTHILQRHVDRWHFVAIDANVHFNIVDLRHEVTVNECIRRDSFRDGNERVGRDVILNMATMGGLRTQERPCVYFDLDGTLANIDDRKAKSTVDGKFNWGEFFNPENIWLDQPRRDVWKILKDVLDEGNIDIILVSGRSDATRKETERWLLRHGEEIMGAPKLYWWDRLIMRSSTDYRPDDTLKEWFLDNYLEGGKNCIAVYDDRKRVIDMWKRRGLNVVPVGDGPGGINDF